MLFAILKVLEDKVRADEPLPESVYIDKDGQIQLKPDRYDVFDIRSSSHETQQSISQWADETFGKIENSVAGRRRGLARLVEEIKEFLELCDGMPEEINDEYYEALKLEIADIIIVGNRLVGDAVDRKMAINRQRKWRKDGTGHGYHIKEGE